MKRKPLTLSRLPSAVALAGAVALMVAGVPMQAQVSFYGNDTNAPPQGAADAIPPFVILGEYSQEGPLDASHSSVRLHAGNVQDVDFYGQGCRSNFTLYALAYVGPGPNLKEQVFRVEASQSFPDFALANPTNISLQVTNFPVYCGELLAFAGIGPFYSNYTNLDGINNDATYENSISSSGYKVYMATPPGGRGTVITNGVYPDPSATYEYILNNYNNQGRNYAIGVDVLKNGVCTNDCLSISCPDDNTYYTCSNSLTVPYQVGGDDICAPNFTLTSASPSGTVMKNISGSGTMTVNGVFGLGQTTVANLAVDSMGNVESCSFTVTILPGSGCTNTTNGNCPTITNLPPTESCSTVPSPSETFTVIVNANTSVNITWIVSSPGGTTYTTSSTTTGPSGSQIATVSTAASVWDTIPATSSSETTIPLTAGTTYNVSASASGMDIPTNCLPNSVSFSVTNCPATSTADCPGSSVIAYPTCPEGTVSAMVSIPSLIQQPGPVYLTLYDPSGTPHYATESGVGWAGVGNFNPVTGWSPPVDLGVPGNYTLWASTANCTNVASFTFTNSGCVPCTITVTIKSLDNLTFGPIYQSGFSFSSGWCTYSSPSPFTTAVYTIPNITNNAATIADWLAGGEIGLQFALPNGTTIGTSQTIPLNNNNVTLFVKQSGVLTPVGENGGANAGPHGGGGFALLTFLALAIAYQLLRGLRRNRA
ncbi:MAG: hypothetical protein WBN22_05215 [Verrucomicrobiia bacterium]